MSPDQGPCHFFQKHLPKAWQVSLLVLPAPSSTDPRVATNCADFLKEITAGAELFVYSGKAENSNC